ncbi:MAG: type II toxin-antitoxin system RelE/ParE family toxin [Candidatus Gastranaerophilales bacterium]|nr:type II toxin-antitoxin system RelE/ParE family toxin [Candidatus Gastranaerophilales bacterium]
MVLLDNIQKLNLILTVLNKARKIEHANIPSFKLHRLKGDMKNLWSVTVQVNWRITFKFENEDVYIVDYQDYH